MTTKAEERKALDQIRNIVAGLGEDSYVGTAFEGVFEIAEENIDNDFACSLKERYACVARQLDAERNRCESLEKINHEMNKKMAEIDAWRDRYNESRNHETELWNQYCEENKKANELEDEVIRLKAKLYDMIVKEER